MSIQVQIKKSFDEFSLDVGFTSESRRIGILGASGCGKSMTLQCLAGIIQPDSGLVMIDEQTYYDAGKRIDRKPKHRNIGYLFQNYALFPTMTVEKNIRIGMKCSKQERAQKGQAIMKRFRIAELADRLPGELSGGQQQRAALARILASEPEVILLDEPFSALDVYLRDQMQQELLSILEDFEGTVIMVSHSRDEIYRFSEEVVILDGGQVIGAGDTKKMFENPHSAAAARLTGCKNIAAIQRLAAGKIKVSDWDMECCLLQAVPADVKGLAIRAHEFRIQKPESGHYLTFPVLSPRITEDLFEYSIAFYASPAARDTIQWKIGKEVLKIAGKKLPSEIYLPEEKLLFLHA